MKIKKKNSSDGMRFLKYLLDRKQAAIVIILFVILAGLAGYLIYPKATKQALPKTAVVRDANPVQTKEHTKPSVKNAEAEKEETQTVVTSEPVLKKRTVTLTLGWETGSKEVSFEPADEKAILLSNEEKLISQFEEDALAETPAIRIKVPKPGNVLFAINRSDINQMPEIMEQIADLYMNTVSEEPVTVHFMVGGGVRGVHTFLPD